MGRNKNKREAKTKLKRDPGVPKLQNFKLAKSVKDKVATQRAAQQSGRPQDVDAPMPSELTLSSLASEAEAISGMYNDPGSSSAHAKVSMDGMDDSWDASPAAYAAQLRRQHVRALHHVIEESDVILLVLDARDPDGCRSKLIEDEVRRREHEGKRLVFVLNKIDLIPRSNAEAWLRYLRHTAPTLPFRSSIQQQRQHLTSHTAPALLNLLKALRRAPGGGNNGSSKKGSGAGSSVTVGVVGYPNVGKSSLINSLRRARVCGVAATPGHTRTVQSVQVERGVRVLDSPGVVFDDDTEEDDKARAGVLLRNAVRVEDINDPISVVDQILHKTSHQKLQSIYNLPAFTSTPEFLTMLALSTGRLQHGGIPDTEAAARVVIRDWNAQKIPFYAEPPSTHPSQVPEVISGATATKYGIADGPTIAPGAEDVGTAAIVSELAPAFDLAGLFAQADAGVLDSNTSGNNENTNQDVEANNDANMITDDDAIENEGSEGEMELTNEAIDSDEGDTLPPKKRVRCRSRSRSRCPSPDSHDELNRRLCLSLGASLGAEARRVMFVPAKRRRLLPQHKYSYSVEDTSDTRRGREGAGAPRQILNRRALKRDAKKARKAARRAAKHAVGAMEVDDEGNSLGVYDMELAGTIVD